MVNKVTRWRHERGHMNFTGTSNNVCNFLVEMLKFKQSIKLTFPRNKFRQGLTYNNIISHLIMVSDFWSEIHIPHIMRKCLVHFLGQARSDSANAHCPGPLSILIWSKNCPKITEFGLFQSQILCWWRIISRTCSKNE